MTPSAAAQSMISCWMLTVDALDQFARRVVLVEAEVEVQHVRNEVGAQGVGHAPTDAFGQPGRRDRRALVSQVGEHDDPGEHGQVARGTVPGGAVDDDAQHPWDAQLHGEVGHDQDRHRSSMGPEVGAERAR